MMKTFAKRTKISTINLTMNLKNTFPTESLNNNDSPRKGPDFIGVGPEKTGTTWIYKHLNDHPQTLCAPIKELRYFWEQLHFPKETFWSKRLKRESWHRVQYHWYFKNRVKNYLFRPKVLMNRKRLIWDFKYLFSVHDDEWYLSSFDNRSGYFSGEISPQYFFLPESQIVRISRLLPNTKFIISLRYPPEWAWSFTRMSVRNRHIENSKEAMEQYISTLIKECSFSKNIQIWQRHIPKDHLKIVFYDQLEEKPHDLYNSLCNFLGIQPETSPLQLSTAVNKGRSLKVPTTLNELLSNGWKDDIVALQNLVPDVPKRWIMSSKEI